MSRFAIVRWLRRSLLCSLLVFLSGPVKAAPPEENASRVLADWKARRTWYKTVRYRLSGSQVFTPSVWAGTAHSVKADVVRPESMNILLDFTKNRIRVERKTEVASGADSGPITIPYNHVYTFGDNGLKFFYDRKENETADSKAGDSRPDLTFLTPNNPVFPPPELEPLFWSHGIVSLPLNPIHANSLAVQLSPDDLLFQGVALLNRYMCSVFRSETIATGQEGSYAELWVANGSFSPILRKTIVTGKRPIYSHEVEYRQVNDRTMVGKWSSTAFLGGKVGKTYRLEVQDFEADPAIAEEDFDTAVQPGMLVSKGDVTYLAQEGGSLVPLRSDVTGKPVAPTSISNMTLWVCLIGALFLVCALLIWFRFRHLVRS